MEWRSDFRGKCEKFRIRQIKHLKEFWGVGDWAIVVQKMFMEE